MNSHQEEHDDGFYKGLFYGVVMGVGLIWFFGTKEGKLLKEEILEKGQNFLEKSRPSLDQIDEDEPLSPER